MPPSVLSQNRPSHRRFDYASDLLNIVVVKVTRKKPKAVETGGENSSSTMARLIAAMKTIMTILTVCAWLASTGCVSHTNRDQPIHPAQVSGGVDHGEYPGDMNHGDTMQR